MKKFSHFGHTTYQQPLYQGNLLFLDVL
jgi:hypothetical protein